MYRGVTFETLICFSFKLLYLQEMEEFWALKLLFETLLKKLSCSSELELEELMEIPGVKQVLLSRLS